MMLRAQQAEDDDMPLQRATSAAICRRSAAVRSAAVMLLRPGRARCRCAQYALIRRRVERAEDEEDLQRDA